jgi:hypothetical protein
MERVAYVPLKQEAGVFELRYRKIDDGPDEAWYRERTQQISM